MQIDQGIIRSLTYFLWGVAIGVPLGAILTKL